MKRFFMLLILGMADSLTNAAVDVWLTDAQVMTPSWLDKV